MSQATSGPALANSRVAALAGTGRAAATRALVTPLAACGLLCGDAVAFAVVLAGSRLLAPERWRVGEASGLYRAAQLGADWRAWGTAVALVAVIASFHLLGHYTKRIPFWRECSQIIATTMIALFAISTVKAAVDGAPLRLWMSVMWLALIPATVLGRALARVLLARAGHWSIRTLIVGDPSAVEEVGLALRSQRGLGYDIVGGIPPEALACMTDDAKLAKIRRTLRAEFVVVVLGGEDAGTERSLVRALDRARVPYAVVPHVQTMPVLGVSPQYFFSHDVMLLVACNNLARPLSRAVKAAFDMVLALALLAALSPVFVLLTALVCLDGGPALFCHERVGANGRSFRCFKFRTMGTDADQVLRRLLASDPAAEREWAETRKLRNDPRITRIGKILRHTSLDELPQLFNVLRGEMSLVGPRPIVHAEIEHYADNIAYYLETRPGLTGLWQVSGRSETTYERRVKLDVWYVRNWSLWHDITILLKTIPAVLRQRGSA